MQAPARLAVALFVSCLGCTATLGQTPATSGASANMDVYRSLKKFELSGGTAAAENLVLKRDRAEMTFTGKFYFEAPVAGRVRSAVFIGRGTFRAEVPNSSFERDHVRRMLKADVVESDFLTAVLRFTDDSFDAISSKHNPSEAATPEALELADEFGGRMLKETGVNLAARMAISILNGEKPGIFHAQFDKGRRKRFSLLLDYQGRVPVTAFGVNGGEKGLVYSYSVAMTSNDVWMAFYGADDYQTGRVKYSDAFDLVEIQHHKLNADVREPKKRLKYTDEMRVAMLADGTSAIPLGLNEGLTEYDNVRLKKALRVKAARLETAPLEFIQEDWEGGITLLLPAARKPGEVFTVALDVEGDFMYDTQTIPDSNYPLSNETWFPRHGDLNRSTFDITFTHNKRHRVASIGARVREEAVAGTNDMVTQWRMEMPVPIATFGMGPFERHSEKLERQGEGGALDVEFYSLPGGLRAIKEDFILAELMNSVNFFNVLFGKYPYSRFGAVFHPFGYGIGYPSMLRIPATDRASKYTYSFVAHETAHQWWGNIVCWRSYRDQWLSEGFAEYSGVLYTARRDKPAAARELIDEMRRSLKDPPETLTGIGKGRLVDVGPIILGHRLSTRETLGAYQALIYSKGGLVLRMLHFLFSDPATGDDAAFFKMMGDFVKRHENGWATTDTFRAVANEHFVKTPIARKYQMTDLNWFFRQWVYEAHHPTYRMEYQVDSAVDGVTVSGVIYQENVPENWFMPLPLVVRFDKDQRARGTVHAQGPKTPFSIKLPAAPKHVELDPDLWVLSEKTSTSGRR